MPAIPRFFRADLQRRLRRGSPQRYRHRVGAEAVTAVVNETPAGAAGSVLYTALMAYLSVDQFETMMRALVAAERVACRGDRYFPIGQRRKSLARRRGSEGRR